MLTNSAIDIAIGAIPFLGDVFDLWFKSNTRNLALIRRHLEEPETSTQRDWVVLLGMLAVLVAIVAVLGWFVVSLISAIAGAL